jgi:hypothetical protein
MFVCSEEKPGRVRTQRVPCGEVTRTERSRFNHVHRGQEPQRGVKLSQCHALLSKLGAVLTRNLVDRSSYTEKFSADDVSDFYQHPSLARAQK